MHVLESVQQEGYQPDGKRWDGKRWDYVDGPISDSNQLWDNDPITALQHSE